MSIIQKIRDKYARVAVIAIALALLGFILTDYISGRGNNLFSGNNSSTVGRVNGKKIEINDFEKKVQQYEDYMQQNGFSPGGTAAREQAIEAVWNQEVSRLVLNDEIVKLGIDVGKKEINDMLFGANPPEDLRKQFTDPATGQYNAAEAMRQINEMKRKGTPEAKDNFNTYIGQMEDSRKMEKYNSMLNNSINFPKWLIEKQNAENSLLGRISMVREVYSSIPDSAISVSDDEIEAYISKHKDNYKQAESRSIQYVAFSAAPSARDSQYTREKLLETKAILDTTKNVEQLLASEGISQYYGGYVSKNRIEAPSKDSIFKTPAGHVYGPYLDGGNYTLAKVEGVRQMPDTAKVRHILISTAQRDPQTQQMRSVRDTATAKKTMDSIHALLRSGKSFDSLLVLSEDPGSVSKGGVYDSVPTGQMVPEFNDFIFGNPVGTKDVVKTEFGYHYIEILSQKGNAPAYKVAYLPKQIISSRETHDSVSNLANLFAGDSRDIKTFDDSFDKTLKPLGLNKGIAIDIKPADSRIQGLPSARAFVKRIYEAKLGEVISPEHIENLYVVAVVTEINKPGTQSASKARFAVEPLLRNKKKAEQLKQKIGKVTTIEAAALALGNKPIELVDSIRLNFQPKGMPVYEPKVNGATFNADNKGKVVPEVLAGQNGVYVIRVESVTGTPVANANVSEQRRALYQQAKQTAMYSSPANALKNAASIKDNRASRF